MYFKAILLLLLFPWPAFAQRDAIVPDPDPELERKSFIVDPRFEVNLFAADPLLAKPIQMNWDAAGRLWIASSEVYPQIRPGQKANDKIIILEDTKGVGRADKTTIYADGLLIPTGLEPGDGGVYVANSAELIHLSEPGPDGKATKRRIVLSGFGTEDTHHILHTLRWGPDGLLYMNQSIYIHSHIETPYGPRTLNAGGIWQFNPHTMQLEVFARGWVNPWGHTFDKYGNSFVTDGAGGEGINYVIPGGYYVTAADAKRTFPGLNPGSPKYCGLEILSGRHLPEDWQGNLITNDFRGHRVCRFVLKEDGAGFAAIEQPELIKSNHPAFRPIDVKMGPDGAIYIADWYNPIIQHGEVDFRDPRRDVTHGRIWRVTAKGRPPVKAPKLVDASTQELLEALKAPEDWTRHFAKRGLLERNSKEVMSAIVDEAEKMKRASQANLLFTFKLSQYHLELVRLVLALNSRLSDKEFNDFRTGRDFALHDLVRDVTLSSTNKRLRAGSLNMLISANSMQHTPCIDAITFDIQIPLNILASDERRRSRPQIQEIRLLGLNRKVSAVEHALGYLKYNKDRFLDYALWLTVRELEPQWLPAFREGKLKFDDPKALLFAVEASRSPQLVEPLLKLLQQGDIKGETADALWSMIAQLGGPNELKLLWEQSLDNKLSLDQRMLRLQALEQAARQRQVTPAGDLAKLVSLVQSNDANVQAVALRLMGLWKQAKLQKTALALLQDSKQSQTLRIAATDALAGIGGPENLALLQRLSTDEADRTLRLEALLRLVKADLALATPVLSSFCHTANEAELTKLMPALLQQKGGPPALTAALGTTKMPADMAKIGQRLARSTGQPHQPLIDAFAKAGNLEAMKWNPTPELVNELVAFAKEKGDPARGEQIFRRKELNCLKCHAIGGAGGQVGPDLSSIGSSAQPDYLVESILLPSKSIKENYNTTVVSTTNGKIITGVKQIENNQELVLRDAEDAEVHIAIKDIEERTQGKSLMPEGQADVLTKAEFVDLIRFLSEIGKVGPYAVGTSRVARTWQALVPNQGAREAISRNSLGAAATNGPKLIWNSEYTTVGGMLPLDVIPDVYVRKKGEWDAVDRQIGFARTKLEVGTAGEVLLVFNSVSGIQGWLDGSPVEMKNEVRLKLNAGQHTLTLAVDKKQRQEGLRIELKDAPGSAGQARWVLGK